MLEFERKVSVGNLLSITAMAVAVVMGYARLDAKTDGNARDSILLDRRLTIQETQLGVLKDAVSADRLSTAKILTEIQSDMKYMRTAIDDLRNKDG